MSRAFRVRLEATVEQYLDGGDLAELGTYLGKSAVLIGEYVQPGETSTVIDDLVVPLRCNLWSYLSTRSTLPAQPSRAPRPPRALSPRPMWLAMTSPVMVLLTHLCLGC